MNKMTTDHHPSNSYELSESLQKLTKGTGLVFIGQIVTLFCSFIGVALIARHWTESEIGVYTLAFTVIDILMVITTLGLAQGIVRSIAHSFGKNEIKKIPDFIATSIFYTFITGVILGLLLFFLSDEIAQNIFHEPSIILPLKIFAILIPLSPLINVIVCIFRGFDQIKPTVYFTYIFRSMLFPIFVGIIIIFNLSFINIFYAQVISTIITLVFCIIYFVRKMSSWLSFTRRSITSPFSKELIIFSLPLVGTAVLGFIFSTTDKLMLGGFKGAADVGLYSVAISLAPFISFPLGILVIVFVPIFSGLYAKGLLEEMRRNYSILTKWICSASLPIFITLFLFPGPALNVLFGSEYVPAALTLRILALAYITNNFTGPCNATLLALGKTRFILIVTLVCAILNIIFNILLIPHYGLIGAAIATGISIVIINLLRVWKIYSMSKIHPLSKNLIKPTLLSIIIIITFYFISKSSLILTWWSLLLVLIFFYIIYIISTLITKSLDEEDLKMLLVIEKKTGIKSNLIRKIITKFL